MKLFKVISYGRKGKNCMCFRFILFFFKGVRNESGLVLCIVVLVYVFD